MDYVIGSVAALITGNVTPNRPRLMKRALTPTKHQSSPNVTPKSEFVDDRSIFLSPSMQKKKAIVKKSPKRIFQNPDLETTENSEGNSSINSPKADKVKKHLKDDLEADSVSNKSMTNPKSPKTKANNKRATSTQKSNTSVTEQDVNVSTPTKKKKKQNSESEITGNVIIQPTYIVSTEAATTAAKSPKKRKQRRKSVVDTESNKENDSSEKVNEPENPSITDKNTKKLKNKSNLETTEKSNELTNQNTSQKKKNRKRRKKSKSKTPVESSETKDNVAEETNKEIIQKENVVAPKKKNKKRNKSKAQQNKPEIMETDEHDQVETDNETEVEITKSKSTVNPNAITDKESDSEHESDDEIESENEEINKKVLESEKPQESSDEEDEEPKVEKKEVEKKEVNAIERNTEEEIQRTLFVGNVLFSVKCKKEIKKIFNKHGQIETIRIRTVPIKDGRYTPKLAVIKNELHPERTTVNVYIKYGDIESVDRALIENNTVLNGHHLRVSRSSSTGAEHDPRCSVFIGNLPFAMEDEALRAKFEKCGEIQSVRIVRDKKTNAGKGFGYVNFESKDGVELALALTEEDLTVKNRILRVKRCTQVTNKKKPVTASKNHGQQQPGFRSGNNQMNQQRGDFRSGNNHMNQQRGDFRSGNNQGNQQRGGFRTGNNQVNEQRGRSTNRSSQGDRQRAFGAGNNQQRGGFNKFANQRNMPQKDEEGREGAHRRVMNKRKNQDTAGSSDGPPNKVQKNIIQPNKEKKSRKEFVGMTAEKKKKRKVDKGQKKKKALSEILTK